MVSFPWVWAEELIELAEKVGMGVKRKKKKQRQAMWGDEEEEEEKEEDAEEEDDDDEIVEIVDRPNSRAVVAGPKPTRPRVIAKSDDEQEIKFVSTGSSSSTGVKTFGGVGNVLGGRR